MAFSYVVNVKRRSIALLQIQEYAKKNDYNYTVFVLNYHVLKLFRLQEKKIRSGRFCHSYARRNLL